jgi:hypothetical protein
MSLSLGFQEAYEAGIEPPTSPDKRPTAAHIAEEESFDPITCLLESVKRRADLTDACGVLNAMPTKLALNRTITAMRENRHDDRKATERAIAELAAVEAAMAQAMAEEAALRAQEDQDRLAAEEAAKKAADVEAEARELEAAAHSERVLHAEELRLEIEQWAGKIFDSDGSRVRGVALEKKFGGLGKVFAEEEYASCVDIVYRYHCRHNMGQELTPSQFIHLVKEANLDEDIDLQSSVAPYWESRAGHDAIFLKGLKRRFSHGELVSFDSFLAALIRLSGTDRVKDWTEEAIARDQLRNLLQRSLVPLARFLVEEPVEVAEHMEHSVIGLLEEHWEPLQALFYRYAVPRTHREDMSCHLSTESLCLPEGRLQNFLEDYGLLRQPGEYDALLQEAVDKLARQGDDYSVVKDQEGGFFGFTWERLEAGSSRGGRRVHHQLTALLISIMAQPQLQDCLEAWRGRILGCYQHLEAFVRDPHRAEVVAQVWRYYSVDRASDRSAHIYHSTTQSSTPSILPNPAEGPVQPRRSNQSFTALRAESGPYDGVMPLAGFEALVKACGVSDEILTHQEVHEIAQRAAPPCTQQLGFDHFLLALLHVARISNPAAASPVDAFFSFVEHAVLPRAQRLDPNLPESRNHPRMQPAQPTPPPRPTVGPGAWEALAPWALHCFAKHQEAHGLGVDEVISQRVRHPTKGLSPAEMYAIVEDAGCKPHAEGDIEALIAEHSGGAETPVEASRRDFVRLLVRTAERLDLDAAHRLGAQPNPEASLWKVLDGLVLAARALQEDPLTDRMEPRVHYRDYGLSLQDFS